jgi:hypothetical protein
LADRTRFIVFIVIFKSISTSTKCRSNWRNKKTHSLFKIYRRL